MGDPKRPRRNLFDEIGGWIAGSEPTSPQGAEAQRTPTEVANAPAPLRSARRRFAQLFWIVGTIFALLQLVFSTLDLANRTVSTFVAWSRFLIPALFMILIATEIYYAVRPDRRVGRRAPLIALALTVAIGAAWGGWILYQAVRPPKAVTVLIADFEGRQAKRGVDWGDRIYAEVNDQVDRLDLGDRVEVQRAFEAFDSPEQARKLGDSRKATMVIWGKYDDVSVWPRFELLRTAKRFESRLGPPPEELADFDLYLRSGPQEMAYIVAVVLGLVRYADADYGAAENLFTAALQNAPQESELLGQEVPRFYRAAARFAGTAPEDRPMAGIVADLEEAVRMKPDFWQAHWNLALAYSDYCTPTLTLDAALAEAGKVRDLKPAAADSNWLLGLVYERRGELPEARAAYEQAVRDDPGHAGAQEALGKVLDALGDAAAARQAYDQALVLRQEAVRKPGKAPAGETPPDPVEALDAEGYAFLNAGQYDRAVETFTEVLRRRPDDAKYHRHLGNAYYWQGKTEAGKPSAGLDKAIAEYERARQLAPRDSLLLTVLGGAYEEAGNAEAALEAYGAAVASAPCDDEALFLLAAQFDTMGREAEAGTAFHKLVELNPKQAAGWHWLATDAFARQDYAAAAQAYRTAAALEPGSADLYYGLGASLYALKDYAGAEDAYRQASTLAPDDAPSLTGWADSLARLGRTGDAIAAYERAVQLAPDYLSWLSLGLLYEKAGRYADAATAYDRGGELRPEDAVAPAASGRMRQRLGDYAAAVADYERALQLDPENASYWESLARNYAAASRPDDALKAAEKTLERNPKSAVAYLVRAGVYEERGDLDSARADYRQALALAGDNAGVTNLAQSALGRLGD
jgi:tetratricopeptide (TPR) repeat protein